PGEKLHEELIAPDEFSIPTSISKVRLIGGHANGGPHVLSMLPELESEIATGRTANLHAFLCAFFPTMLAEEGRRLELITPFANPAQANGDGNGNGAHAVDAGRLTNALLPHT
ncbi:MAG: hypothetical protein ACREMQ_07615, partial [Longimicrobiales bacterium]